MRPTVWFFSVHAILKNGVRMLVDGAQIVLSIIVPSPSFPHSPLCATHFLLGSSNINNFTFMAEDSETNFLRRLNPEKLDFLPKVSVLFFFLTLKTVLGT